MKPQTLLFLFTLVFSLGAKSERILVIESYHGGYSWVASHTRGLEEVLSLAHELVYFEMDTKRLPDLFHQRKAEEAWRAYNHLSPKLVVLADDNALKYLAPKLKTTNTPVVYLGINANPRDYGVGMSNNFYGVLERLLIKRSILMLRGVFPFERILVLFDNGTTSKAIFKESFNGQGSLISSNVQVDVRTHSTFKQWQESVVSASDMGYDAILIGLYHNLVDESGRHVPEDNVIEWTSSQTKVPPFGLWDYSVGAKKSIGGYVISGYQQGLLAGKLAKKLIDGEVVSAMPQTTNSAELLFSQTQLKKWKLHIPSGLAELATVVDN